MEPSRRIYGAVFGTGPLAVKKHPLKDSSFHRLVKTSLRPREKYPACEQGYSPVSTRNVMQTRWAIHTDYCSLGRLKI